jgi:SAM-dependent methyltransferase
MKIRPKRWLRSFAARRRFRREFAAFRKMAAEAGSRFPVRWEDRWPCLKDRTPETRFDRHYVFHTAWAARVLARTRPERHVDVAGWLPFVTTLSAFVPVDFYDLRPARLPLEGLRSAPADLLALPFEDRSVRSISCMHVIEHVGLGRYGDPLDPDGDRKAIAELTRVLAPGGDLLFVVPIGRARIQFNAHRVYSWRQVRELFASLELVEFALIPEKAANGDLVVGATEAQADAETYGCGCFWFRRRA